MILTIFTPLYNRANYLNQIYNSILTQSSHEALEWVIVDDGSMDNAIEEVNAIKANSPFEIKYFYQKNKGKHYAVNKALGIAKGELFFILDSDDLLSKDALKIVVEKYQKIKNNENVAGVVGRRNFDNGKIVGNQTFDELVSNSIDIRYKYRVTGDLVEIYKTNIFKQFKFPQIPNEKFCPEVLVWNRIAQHHDLLFFNKGIYTTQYLKGGLTDKIVKIRMTAPIASMLTYSELASYKIPFIQKIKAYTNFWRFAFNSKKSFKQKLNMLKHKIAIVLQPIGFLMYLRDKKQYP